MRGHTMTRGKPDPEYVGKPPEAVRAFQVQRARARGRSIEWQFTFTEWWAWWQTDDRWSNRGVGWSQFVMARKGDAGPYSPENVYCATQEQNHADVPYEVRSTAMKGVWSRQVISTPILNKGAGHPRSVAIETPAGRFANATEAAAHFGITRQGIRYRITAGVAGWRYAQEKE